MKLVRPFCTKNRLDRTLRVIITTVSKVLGSRRFLHIYILHTNDDGIHFTEIINIANWSEHSSYTRTKFKTENYMINKPLNKLNKSKLIYN